MQSNVIKCPLQTHLQCTVLDWVIKIKIHDCHFCNVFNLNMTCGEFGLPIINENVSENGVTAKRKLERLQFSTSSSFVKI